MKLTRIFTLLVAGLAMLTACDNNTEGNSDNGGYGATLTFDKETVEVNTPVTFTVTTTEGEDVTATALFYDKTHGYKLIENPFTPTEDGKYDIYAVSGNYISQSATLVVTPAFPALPEDKEEANLAFNHRILLVDHSGTQCSACPGMMNALKELEEDEAYHGKYHEAISHSFNTNDPASSSAAYALKTFFSVNEYPTLTYNFAHSAVTVSANLSHTKQQIDALWSAEGADVGITAAASLGTNCVAVNTEVKAKSEGEYRITAWLLEDGIYQMQSGASEEWHNTHNNALRATANDKKTHLSGYDLGTLTAGAKSTKRLTLELKSNWVRENLKVLVIASKKNEKGVFDVANVVLCPIGEVVEYDYIKVEE